MWDFNEIINRAMVVYKEDSIFEIIVKYSGDILEIARNEDVIVEILNDSFAIITLRLGQLRDIFGYSQIDYGEISRKLTILQEENIFLDSYYKEPYVCPINTDEKLTGKGIIVSILDTGINYKHKDFRNSDGTTRILYIWDQSTVGINPEGFYEGSFYTKEDIDLSLSTNESLNFVDYVGHGTKVAGVCVGNGNESDGKYKGVAPDADIVVVKLGTDNSSTFAMSTDIMRAVKFSYDVAKKEDKPLVLNLSYGTNNGAHRGVSLFEEYIDAMISSYPSSFVIATGNEGDANHHYETTLMDYESESIEFTVAGGLKSIYFSIWKNFTDDFSIEIVTPDNQSTNKIYISNSVSRYTFNGVTINVIYNLPTPYKLEQEIYCQIDFDSPTTSINTWTLNIYSEVVVDGNVQIWLPTIEEVTKFTAFKNPSKNTTLTIPSTASLAIAVSGYNTTNNIIAPFSGKGFTSNGQIKPDISAPGVDLLTTSNLFGYDQVSGTSFSAPFVAGACAVLMEYGIINKNEIFLYGEKLKAFLQKGAKRSSENIYPNRDFGYGTLCIENTLNILKDINRQLTPLQSDDTMDILINKSDEILSKINSLDFVNNLTIKDLNIANFSILTVPTDRYEETLKKLNNETDLEEGILLSQMGENISDKNEPSILSNSVLDGSGVIIAIIDYDINIFDKAFIKDNKTKIKYFYDMELNLEYNEQEINKLIPHNTNKENNSHGTNLSRISSNVANNANLICINLKKSNSLLQNKEGIDNKYAFSSIDVIKALEFCLNKANILNMPISIGLCLGSSKKSNTESLFEKYLSELSKINGVCLCVSSGNEGNKKHHVDRTLLNEKTESISLFISPLDKSFPIYFNMSYVSFFILQITLPNGEKYTYAPSSESDTKNFKFTSTDTKISIEFSFKKQTLILKLIDTIDGVYTLSFTPNLSIVDTSILHVYLPTHSFLSNETHFISSSSQHTVTLPATAKDIISVGSYFKVSDEIFFESGRGPSPYKNITPTVIANSINSYSQIKGSSVATSELVGICALLLQWGIVDKNQKTMNTITIKELIETIAYKNKNYTYPNNIEGYGIISEEIFRNYMI